MAGRVDNYKFWTTQEIPFKYKELKGVVFFSFLISFLNSLNNWKVPTVFLRSIFVK